MLAARKRGGKGYLQAFGSNRSIQGDAVDAHFCNAVQVGTRDGHRGTGGREAGLSVVLQYGVVGYRAHGHGEDTVGRQVSVNYLRVNHVDTGGKGHVDIGPVLYLLAVDEPDNVAVFDRSVHQRIFEVGSALDYSILGDGTALSFGKVGIQDAGRVIFPSRGKRLLGSIAGAQGEDCNSHNGKNLFHG